MLRSSVWAFVVSVFLFPSCKFFKQGNGKVVAKVYDQTLMEGELKKISGYHREGIDSALRENYIRKWIEKQVILKVAKFNVPIQQQREIEEMVKNYHESLVVNAYKKKVLESFSDTDIPKEEVSDYYERHLTHFLLNEPIYRMVFIETDNDPSSPFRKEVERHLYFFKEKDSLSLSENTLKFQSCFIKKNQWLKLSEITKLIPTINQKNFNTYLKPRKEVTKLPQGDRVFLIRTFEKKDIHSIAPLKMVEPLITKILINKRKKLFLENHIQSLINHRSSKSLSSATTLDK